MDRGPEPPVVPVIAGCGARATAGPMAIRWKPSCNRGRRRPGHRGQCSRGGGWQIPPCSPTSFGLCPRWPGGRRWGRRPLQAGVWETLPVLLLLGVGFLGGLITALSPCIIPVLPVIAAGGSTGGGALAAVRHRRRAGGQLHPLHPGRGELLSLLHLPQDLLRDLGIALLFLLAAGLIVPAFGDLSGACPSPGSGRRRAGSPGRGQRLRARGQPGAGLRALRRAGARRHLGGGRHPPGGARRRSSSPSPTPWGRRSRC